MAIRDTYLRKDYTQKEVKRSYNSAGVLTSTVNNTWGTHMLWERKDYQNSVNTPGFHGYPRGKPLPDNPYMSEKWYTSYDISGSVGRFEYDDGRLDIVENVNSSNVWLDCRDINFTWEFENAARFKALTRLAMGTDKSEGYSQSSGNLGVTLAEAGKTAKMIGNTAVKLAKAVSALKKGRLGDFGDVLGLTFTTPQKRAFSRSYNRGWSHPPKAGWHSDYRQFAANTWLEYSYGWKPLLSDIHSQAQNLANVLTKHEYVVREARGSGKETKETKFIKLDTSEGLWEAPHLVKQETRFRFLVRYRLQNGAAHTANTFGLLNPLEVAWELVPFSFVADWFLPIGSFLGQLSASHGLEFHSGVESKRRILQIQAQARATGRRIRPFAGAWKTLALNGGWSGSAWKDLKWRSKLTDFPSQQFPTFKDPRSFAHAASAIALLQSVFLGSGRNQGSYRL